MSLPGRAFVHGTAQRFCLRLQSLTCEDWNGNAAYSKAIEYADFPLPELELYFTNNTILLPSEY